jgi:hypothetical protein
MGDRFKSLEVELGTGKTFSLGIGFTAKERKKL